MTWDNRDLRPPHGAAGRATVQDKTPGRAPRDLDREPYYPPHRPAGYPEAGRIAQRYQRYQSASLTLAASTVFQRVALFAGRPDRIDIMASAANVEFRFRNRGEEQTDGVVIRTATTYETNLSKEIVEARDPAGTGGQFVSVLGMWTDPYV